MMGLRVIDVQMEKIRIRNVIVVAYLVECTHHLAREIQWPF